MRFLKALLPPALLAFACAEESTTVDAPSNPSPAPARDYDVTLSSDKLPVLQGNTANAIVLQSDERVPTTRVLVSGFASTSTSEFAIARYWR